MNLIKQIEKKIKILRNKKNIQEAMKLEEALKDYKAWVIGFNVLKGIYCGTIL